MTGRNKVLIVDDAAIDRIALRKILDDTYDIIEAENGRQALDILGAQTEWEPISVVLLDLVMPEFSGYEFMREYQKIETYRRTPVVIVTGEQDTGTESRCLSLGAWDFISKPYDPMVIGFRLKNVIERSQHQLSRELKYRADYDILTGIYNKIKFFEVTRALLNQNPLEQYAFIRIDIEKFQLVNSFFGVQEGDKLLRYIAEEIGRFAGNSAQISFGRIEADIFCIFMPYLGEHMILEFVRYLRIRLESYRIDFDILPVIGIYVVENRELPVDGMYDRASLAAKRCKGNYIRNYAFYTGDMSAELIKEQRIVNNMKSALDGDEFVLYLQPKYGLQSNTMGGAEVLVRWNSPTRGMVSPGEFIPVFERNGFIIKLDYYVWRKTCQMLAGWIKEGREPKPVSVNISRVSLYNPRLVELICGLVEEYHIPPELLQLELTESAYTSNPMAIRDTMERLQKAGFSILMDDFGSGYSSLNVLKDIAVDILKIDMKFLSDTDKQERSENILASVVRMAKWLDMPVVAEGVERKEQVDFLRSIGCEYVQGYYFARPMPVTEYETLAFEQKEEHAAAEEKHRIKSDNSWVYSPQFESMLSGMLQAVAVYEYDEVSERLDVLRVNAAYFELFGYSDINDSQKSMLTSVDSEGRRCLLETFRELVHTKDMAECEFVRRMESGELMWIQLKLKYVNLVGNKHVIFGNLTNITEQKALDRELKKYRQAFAAEDHEIATILVVDDVEVNRMSLRCIFEDRYRVLEAENGKEALELLQKNPGKIDIILLDLMMPIMSGTTFLEHKHNDKQIAGIPVIIITSDDTAKRQIHTLELGADDYIVKPFVPEIVSRRVSHVLDAKHRFEHTIKSYWEVLGTMPREELSGLYRRRGDLGQNADTVSETVKAMIIVELNNVREIADQYSYKIAKEVACLFGEQLRQQFCDSEILVRNEKCEFIVCISEVMMREELEQQCQCLLEKVMRIGTNGIKLECTMGAAQARREDESILELIERTDQALFAASQKGRNQFAIV